MNKRLAIILPLFIISSSLSVQSAETGTEKDLGVSLSLGMSLGGEEKGHYLNAPNTKINTTIAFGFGIHYRSISLFHATKLNISAESYYHIHDTDPVTLRFTDATVRYSGYSVPVMIWAELMPGSKFGPFVRIGLGAIWTDWKDECSDDRYYSPHHKFWSFAYGMGGGIYYSPIDKIDILLLVQASVCQNDHFVSDDHWNEHTLFAPWMLPYWGLTFRHWF